MLLNKTEARQKEYHDIHSWLTDKDNIYRVVREITAKQTPEYTMMKDDYYRADDEYVRPKYDNFKKHHLHRAEVSSLDLRDYLTEFPIRRSVVLNSNKTIDCLIKFVIRARVDETVSRFSNDPQSAWVTWQDVPRFADFSLLLKIKGSDESFIRMMTELNKQRSLYSDKFRSRGENVRSAIITFDGDTKDDLILEQEDIAIMRVMELRQISPLVPIEEG